MRKHLTSLIAVVLAGFCPTAATADVVTFQQNVGGYTSGLDTWVGAHHNSNQTGDAGQNVNSGIISTRRSNSSWTADQGLIRFDNIFGNTPGLVPTDPALDGGFFRTVLNSATLTMNVTNTTGGTVRFYRMTTDWDGNIIYNSFNTDGTRGIQAGSETATPFVAELRPDNALPTTLQSDIAGTKVLDITDVLEDWLTGAEPNFGFFISNSSTDTLQFSSFNNANPNLRPLLTVDFAVVPEPASVAMWSCAAAFGAVVFWRRRRRTRTRN